MTVPLLICILITLLNGTEKAWNYPSSPGMRIPGRWKHILPVAVICHVTEQDGE